MRQTILKIFAIVAIVAMLAGCAPAATPTAAPQPTTPPAAAATQPPATGACDVNRPLKVGMSIGQLGDKSFLDSAAAGFKKINADFKNVTTKILENNDVGEQELGARALAQQGYDLIITIGYGSADWTTKVAKDFPNIKFALVDATLDTPNGTGLTFKEHEGSFTVGMVAGFLSKTGKVGYIGGVDVPLLRRFEEGYKQGVLYVNPKATVSEGWVGSFTDPNKAKELALTQFTEGADIIYAAAGKSGEGVLQASKEQGKFSIGVDSDQDYLQPGAVITSMLKRVDLAVWGATKDLVNCSLKAGNKVFGLAEGAVGSTFLYNTDTVFLQQGPADMVKILKDTAIPAVKAAVAKIVSGEFCVTDTYMKVFACDKPAPAGGYKP
jgi:basic membrane protein A and related proteins